MTWRDNDVIEIVPLAYMRGRTFEDAFMILDEAQNTTPEQMKMFLTRMGMGSRAVVTGDATQNDLGSKATSGLVRVLEILKGVDGVSTVRFAEGEAAKLHKLFAKLEDKPLLEGRFDSPIPGAATARFRERRVFNGEPRAPHSGMDLKAKAGKPVRAPAAGRVLLSDPLFYAGNTILIDHGMGLTTMHARLSKMLVKPGDLVKKGQIIGKVGATGRVTGPHLHWALKHKNARIDPYSLVYLDLDAKLRTRPDDRLKRSALRDAQDLPPAPKWGKASGGLRGRARAARASYAPGEAVTLLVEIQNSAKKTAFVDFARDAALRSVVLGVGGPARPFGALASSRAVSGPLTEEVKIPKGQALCFEQPLSADGPLLARETTSYALTYGTDCLYPSTAAVRAGAWRGRIVIPPAAVIVSSGAAAPADR